MITEFCMSLMLTYRGWYDLKIEKDTLENAKFILIDDLSKIKGRMSFKSEDEVEAQLSSLIEKSKDLSKNKNENYLYNNYLMKSL